MATLTQIIPSTPEATTRDIHNPCHLVDNQTEDKDATMSDVKQEETPVDDNLIDKT